MTKEFDIPREILSQFQSYRKGYYSGYWEITSTRTNQCDQEESVKHWNNNQMVIPYIQIIGMIIHIIIFSN